MSLDQPTATLIAAVVAAILGLINYFRTSLERESTFLRIRLHKYEELLAEIIPLIEERNSVVYFQHRAQSDAAYSSVANASIERAKLNNAADEIGKRHSLLKLMLHSTKKSQAELLAKLDASVTLGTRIGSDSSLPSDFASLNQLISNSHAELWRQSRDFLDHYEKLAEPRLFKKGKFA